MHYKSLLLVNDAAIGSKQIVFVRIYNLQTHFSQTRVKMI